MGQGLSKPFWSKFIKEKCWISNKFVKGAVQVLLVTLGAGGRSERVHFQRFGCHLVGSGVRLVEYMPTQPKAILEQTHKGNVLDF